jgi:hypothetical protein
MSLVELLTFLRILDNKVLFNAVDSSASAPPTAPSDARRAAEMLALAGLPEEAFDGFQAEIARSSAPAHVLAVWSVREPDSCALPDAAPSSGDGSVRGENAIVTAVGMLVHASNSRIPVPGQHLPVSTVEGGTRPSVETLPICRIAEAIEEPAVRRATHSRSERGSLTWQ